MRIIDARFRHYERKVKYDGYPLLKGVVEQWRKEADEPYGFNYWMIDDYRDMLEYAGLNRRRLSER